MSSIYYSDIIAYILQNNIVCHETIIFLSQLLAKGTLDPFEIQHNTTYFEKTTSTKDKTFMYMFLQHWLHNLNWKLHDEIYKLESNKDVQSLHYINHYLSHFDKQPIVRHVLGYVQLALLKL